MMEGEVSEEQYNVDLAGSCFPASMELITRATRAVISTANNVSPRDMEAIDGRELRWFTKIKMGYERPQSLGRRRSYRLISEPLNLPRYLCT
jgi:hypothetical protein